jgi:hypothetical protein
MVKAEAAKLKATWGTGEKRPQQQEALVGVSDTVEAQPRSPEARAELLVDPDAARARQQRAGTTDDASRAQPVRRVASLARTTQAVMELIKADAERREPQHRNLVVILRDGALGRWKVVTQLFREWKRVTCVLDSRPGVSYLWTAATALCREGSQDGKRWVQQQLTERLRGRVGDVIGGLRPILTQPLRQSVREALAKVSTCFHNHRRWRPYAVYLAAGLPVGTGVVESAGGSVVQHRMEGEGKRWSLAGAAAMLTVRSRQKSHDNALRDYWRFRARQVRVRLAVSKPPYRPTTRLRCAA